MSPYETQRLTKCMCVSTHVCGMMCVGVGVGLLWSIVNMWRSDNIFMEPLLSYLSMGSGNWTRVSRLAQGVFHSAVPAPPPMLFVKESPLQVAFAKDDGDDDGDFAS